MPNNHYIDRTIAILGVLYDQRTGQFDPLTWDTVDETKQAIPILRQKKVEIRLVKQELATAKSQIIAQFSNKKANVNSMGTRILFGAKSAGKMNSIARHNLDQQKRKALAPYEEAERFIAQALAFLDHTKMRIDVWLASRK